MPRHAKQKMAVKLAELHTGSARPARMSSCEYNHICGASSLSPGPTTSHAGNH